MDLIKLVEEEGIKLGELVEVVLWEGAGTTVFVDHTTVYSPIRGGKCSGEEFRGIYLKVGGNKEFSYVNIERVLDDGEIEPEIMKIYSGAILNFRRAS